MTRVSFREKIILGTGEERAARREGPEEGRKGVRAVREITKEEEMRKKYNG